MRKFLLLYLILIKGLLAFGSVHEAETDIIMYVAKVPVKTGSIRIPRAPRPKLQVAIQNGMICIKSISVIENAHVSIINDNDDSVFDEYMGLSSTEVYIPISVLEIGRTYILKIEYGETILYGYIYL